MMQSYMYTYTVLPMVHPVGEQRELTLRALDPRWRFEDAGHYQVRILPRAYGTRRGWQELFAEEDDAFQAKCRAAGQYEGASWKTCNQTAEAKAADGQLRFTAVFPAEGCYTLQLLKDGRQLPHEPQVYAVEPDLFALRPLKGDLHVHSCRSDGYDSPEVLAANYRQAGFDFQVLSDHSKYEPSQEMQAAYRDVKCDLLMVSGEEVHAPENFVHILNFGGSFSVNRLFQQDPDRYFREVTEIAEKEDIPYFDRFVYAANLWCIRKIREAGGLAIYCHPHWIYRGQYNDPDPLTRLFLTRGEFDAFELIGGQTALENNLQTALWGDLRAEGHRIPIVGSSDSHGTLHCGLFNQMYTIVFARDKTVHSIIEAVKSGYSAAVEVLEFDRQPVVDEKSLEQRKVYADYRLTAYTLFLLDRYFSYQTELVRPEGQFMWEYRLGIPGAAERLESLSGRSDAFYRAAFGL